MRTKKRLVGDQLGRHKDRVFGTVIGLAQSSRFQTYFRLSELARSAVRCGLVLVLHNAKSTSWRMAHEEVTRRLWRGVTTVFQAAGRSNG